MDSPERLWLHEQQILRVRFVCFCLVIYGNVCYSLDGKKNIFSDHSAAIFILTSNYYSQFLFNTGVQTPIWS